MRELRVMVARNEDASPACTEVAAEGVEHVSPPLIRAHPLESAGEERRNVGKHQSGRTLLHLEKVKDIPIENQQGIGSARCTQACSQLGARVEVVEKPRRSEVEIGKDQKVVCHELASSVQRLFGVNSLIQQKLFMGFQRGLDDAKELCALFEQTILWIKIRQNIGEMFRSRRRRGV